MAFVVRQEHTHSQHTTSHHNELGCRSVVCFALHVRAICDDCTIDLIIMMTLCVRDEHTGEQSQLICLIRNVSVAISATDFRRLRQLPADWITWNARPGCFPVEIQTTVPVWCAADVDGIFHARNSLSRSCEFRYGHHFIIIIRYRVQSRRCSAFDVRRCITSCTILRASYYVIKTDGVRNEVRSYLS